MVKHYILGLLTWRTIYKVIAISLCIVVLVIGYLIALFDYQGTAFDETPANGRSGNYLSFFVVQVNILILAYFVNALVFYRNEGLTRWTKPTAKIAFSVYASFTLLVYWIIIFPWILISTPYTIKGWHWIIIAFQNGIIPLLLIIYIVIISYEDIIYSRNFFRWKLWIIILYPLIYLMFILVRGALRLLDYNKHPDLFTTNGKIDWIKIYNYPFLSYNQEVSFINFDGIFTFIFFMIIFTILLLFLVWFYVYIFNYRYDMKHKRKRR